MFSTKYESYCAVMNATVVKSTEYTTQTPVLNISAYRFVKLDRVAERRVELLSLCKSLGLRGTILLSSEGLNLFLAGRPEDIASFLAHLRKDPAFADLETKDSYSETQPFRRMLVRLKKEIIAFGIDSVCPEERTSPKLSARELQAWLDEGRPVRLLDVRNEYEFELGTFEDAEHLNISHFREFPQAILRLPEEAKQQPLVMFCTGGIRCEKAGPMMEQAGFEHVYQLDGGILKYFEECGGQHYRGACFVFDNRVALDPELKPTGNMLCFACQAVLNPDDVASEKFLFGKWCPHCFREPKERMREQLHRREGAIRKLAELQPGCAAYDNLRKIYVPRRFAGLSLIDFLDAWHPPTTREQWLQWIDAQQIRSAGRAASAQQIVREGQCFDQVMRGTIEPPINPDIRLLYEDEFIVVVNKPAPLPVHPSGRYNRNTLTSLMAGAFPKQKLRIAHRLDANTSGVVVLCRTYHAARLVQPQFSEGNVEKAYTALVHGHPEWDSIECNATLSAAPQAGGSRGVNEADGLNACTRLRVLQRHSDGTSLVEARPVTGRTHQIRIHLWHLGFSIVGDPLYLPNQAVGSAHTLDRLDAPMCLHAASITFTHPHSNERVTFEAPQPVWHTSSE